MGQSNSMFREVAIGPNRSCYPARVCRLGPVMEIMNDVQMNVRFEVVCISLRSFPFQAR
jgi:hypothetical protein